jgi:hypothetical protein
MLVRLTVDYEKISHYFEYVLIGGEKIGNFY